MESAVRLAHGKDAYRSRQPPVHSASKIIDRNAIFQRNGGYLSIGVNTGIGAPGSGHFHGLAFYLADDILQNALDARQAGLHLPSVELRSVVSNVETQAALSFHRRYRSLGRSGSWLHHRNSSLAQRAILGIEDFRLQGFKRHSWHAYIG